MNEPEFKSAAFKIAEETPPHLGQPTSPPIHWKVDGENLRVLLADGRTVRAPISAPKKTVSKKQVKVVDLPVLPPARKKAGRIN